MVTSRGLEPNTEGQAIRARHMESHQSAEKRERDAILPIRVGDGDVDGILFNAIVPDVRQRTPEEAAELIVEKLRLVVPGVDVATGVAQAGPYWPEKPTTLLWPIADHSGARDAFAHLLDREAAWRFLPIRGPPSETGKSHITRQMLANALHIPGLACGRFDFKGTTGMDAELRTFVQDLGVPLPSANPELNERLGDVLDRLKREMRPALLIFDTYEAAGNAEDWVEKCLLPTLIRATWLRVVVVGQQVPTSSGAVWTSMSCAPLELVPPPPKDWFEYSKQHRPELTLADVEAAWRLARNKASLLAQMLGPTT